MKPAFTIFIARIACTFDQPLPIGRTVQTKVLSERFPEALRRVTCDTPAIDCRTCAKGGRCAYATLFEPPVNDETAGIRHIRDAAVPFAIRPADRGAVRGHYDLVLAGGAMRHLPEVVNAFDYMGRTGLGREKARYRVTGISALDSGFAPRGKEMTSGSLKKLLEHPPIGVDEMVGAVAISALKTITIRFITPPLLRPGNPDLKPKFGLLMRRLRDRIRVVGMVHCGGAPEMDLRGLAAKADDVVYSNAPGSPRGDILSFVGPMRDCIPILRIGRYLNVGEWCGYGQGWYDIVG